MLFSHIGILDENLDYQPDMFVGTSGERIAYIGKAEPPAEEAPAYGERYDGRGRLLMPAFYNAHAHAPMVLLRGFAENLHLQEWLNDKVYPFEARITGEDARAATDLAAAEMLRFGVVSFSDMYMRDDERCEAVRDAGMKMNISRGVTAFDVTDYRKIQEAPANDHLYEVWDGAADGRIKVDLSIHGEYTNNEPVCRSIAELAAEHGSIIQIHLSETRLEHEECKARNAGRTPAEFFEYCGVFDQPTIAAHCVWVEPGDIEILREHGVTAVCCPASNMKLGSGFAPVPQLLEAGVKLALGTDGVASNNSHNMLRDLYLLATIYKGSSGDPTVVTPKQAVRAATREGALAQGRDDCGIMRVGARADLVALDVSVPWMNPPTSMLANLVYSASGGDVRLTMVDGRVLYRDGGWPTIDVERAMALTDASARRIISEIA